MSTDLYVYPLQPGTSSTKSAVHAGQPEPAGPMSINKDLVAATSTSLVLAILAEGDSYGYAILKRVRDLSGGELEWTDGMLYPVLHRLERSGLVKSRWEKTESGRRRKYYRVTEDGPEAAGRRAPPVADHGRDAPEGLVDPE